MLIEYSYRIYDKNGLVHLPDKLDIPEFPKYTRLPSCKGTGKLSYANVREVGHRSEFKDATFPNNIEFKAKCKFYNCAFGSDTFFGDDCEFKKCSLVSNTRFGRNPVFDDDTTYDRTTSTFAADEDRAKLKIQMAFWRKVEFATGVIAGIFLFLIILGKEGGYKSAFTWGGCLIVAWPWAFRNFFVQIFGDFPKEYKKRLKAQIKEVKKFGKEIKGDFDDSVE